MQWARMSDGDNEVSAKRAAMDYSRALHLMRSARSSWKTKVLTCSAIEGSGVAEVWTILQEHQQVLQERGELQERRQQQRLTWLWSLVEQELMFRLRHHPDVSELSSTLEQDVLQGTTPPTLAAEKILRAFGIDS